MFRFLSLIAITALSSVSFVSRATAIDAPKLVDQVDDSEFKQLCGIIFIDKSTKLKFDGMEKRLICGDPKQDNIGKPWADIPANQAAYFMRGFLQTRGYHEPKLVQLGDKLYVKTGPIGRLTSFRLDHYPPRWKAPKKRDIKGKTLSPALLDDLESWTTEKLKEVGYACAKVKGEANPETGEVVMKLEEGQLQKVLGIDDLTDTTLRENVLSRYHAFFIGDYYNQMLVDLSKRRTMDDNIVQSLELRPKCAPEGVTILRSIDEGKARRLTLGVGGSTEEGPKVRAQIRQDRIGSMASSAQATASASWVDQQLDASARWFYSHYYVNSFIEPEVTLDHRNESRFKYEQIDTHIFHGWGWGFHGHSFSFKFGPEHLQVLGHQDTSIGPDQLSANLISARLNWSSYDWEWWRNSPRSGWNFNIDTSRAQKEFSDPFTAQRITIQGESLWNIGNYDPPLLVVGVRGRIGTTAMEEGNPATQLPYSFLYYAGGDEDLRAFPRISLPWDSAYALTLVSGSLELRLYKALFDMVDPFIFCDVGSLGQKSFGLDKPIFLSPGGGLRWESFIGTLRAYVADPVIVRAGLAEQQHDKALHFGATLGEEF